MKFGNTAIPAEKSWQQRFNLHGLDLEERVAEAKVVFGLNSYQELCGLHLGGISLLSSGFIIDLANRGGKHARKHIEMMKALLEEDSKKRQEGVRVSFVRSIEEGSIKSSFEDRIPIKIPSRERRKNVKNDNKKDLEETMEEENFEIQQITPEW
ncbi:hypothetical protein DMENIID0001_113920 [Sergentomyia squamirostris]